jgi:hypothetical protein
MADKPILFKPELIRALLEGRKTQTRRVLKAVPPAPAPNCHPRNEPPRHSAPYLDAYCGEPKTAQNPRGMGHWWNWWQVDDRACLPQFKVGVAPGDRLWVREPWRTDSGLDHLSGKGIEKACLEAGYKSAWAPIVYSDGSAINWEEGHGIGRYRHARFMPRWASRLTLIVEGVRVQRLQDISRIDASAEGCVPAEVFFSDGRSAGFSEPRLLFRDLWTSINGPGSWEANPWVAAFTFRLIRTNIDQVPA